MVEILDVAVDEDGQVWEKVSTDMSGTDCNPAADAYTGTHAYLMQTARPIP